MILMPRSLPGVFRVQFNRIRRCPLAGLRNPQAEAFGYTWADLQWFTIDAMKSAFIPFGERLDIINTRIESGYAALIQ